MNKKFLFVSISFLFTTCISAQIPDSIQSLSEIIVKAFEQHKQLNKTSAAINIINQSQLNRFSNNSILQAVNSSPGIRMEERSPGSYRMNIRGSTLRSPFGVRNVKIYLDEFPFTDAGGNTYLNQLNSNNFNSIEIIKGPGGSLYGSGTGGVMLIQTHPSTWKKNFSGNITAGSYGAFNSGLQLQAGKESWQHILNYSYQDNDGYRDHSSMVRHTANWQTKIQINKKQVLKVFLLYGDLNYQTPGALTKTEWLANPKAARPKAGIFPSADSARAAIFQKMFFGGIAHSYDISANFENSIAIYGSYVDLKNPTFRNYEKRTEPQLGGRTVFRWKQSTNRSMIEFIFGGEFQKGFFNTKTYTNNYGSPGTIVTNDDIDPAIYSLFAQGDVQFPKDWNLTAGLGSNHVSISIDRLSVSNFNTVKRKFNNEIAPRLAISKKIIGNLWLYSSISKGFSAPTVAEILPSTSVISTDLQPEHGINYEAGIKSNWFQQRLYFEVNAFYFKLQKAIVQRKDASNADYFINAGSTKQKGIETQATYQLLKQNTFIRSAEVWLSHTFNDFKYDSFKQSTTDYSGKKLPSVAKHTIAAGLDMNLVNGLYSCIQYFYSDPIALNDANSEFAASYNLLGWKIGYKRSIREKKQFDFFAGVENIFDVTYSLGNDINAAGGRYYNAAAGRNFYAGISFHFN